MRTGRGFERLVNFTDAVIAIAVTLLVLPLVEIPGEDNVDRVTSIIQSTAKLEIHAVSSGPYTDEADAMTKLVSQLTRPVRWDLCTESLRSNNVSAIVEFPPAGTLAGIAKRELRGVPTHAVKSPADLDGLAGL